MKPTKFIVCVDAQPTLYFDDILDAMLAMKAVGAGASVVRDDGVRMAVAAAFDISSYFNVKKESSGAPSLGLDGIWRGA